MFFFESGGGLSNLLQRELDRDLATMEVVSGDESFVDENPLTKELNFGPYTVSPARGLHFVAEDDSAAS